MNRISRADLLAIVLSLLLVLALMSMIFFFSSQSAEESDEASGTLVQLVLKLFHPDYDTYTPQLQDELDGEASFFIRKLAHFTEYAMLGAALMLHLLAIRRVKPVRFAGCVALVIGFLYACTDELHQGLVSGRSPSVRDVCIDSFGVLAGLAFVLGVRHFSVKKKRVS